jgi:hypothetical protein
MGEAESRQSKSSVRIMMWKRGWCRGVGSCNLADSIFAQMINQKRQQFIVFLALVIAISLAVWFGTWWAVPEVAKTVPQATISATKVEHEPRTSAPFAFVQQEVPTGIPSPSGSNVPSPKDGQLSGPEMLDRWLASSTQPEQIGQAVLNGFPSLQQQDQAMAARQLVNFVSDAQFAGMKALLLDPKISDEAKDVLYRDVLIRPLPLRLPTLMTIMQQREHPCAENARRDLGRLLGGDWGMDYARWQAQISDLLRRLN